MGIHKTSRERCLETGKEAGKCQLKKVKDKAAWIQITEEKQ